MTILSTSKIQGLPDTLLGHEERVLECLRPSKPFSKIRRRNRCQDSPRNSKLNVGNGPTSVSDNDLAELCKYGEHQSRKLSSRAHNLLLWLSWLRNVSLAYQWLLCPLIMVEALCCISVDVDAVAGWLGSYGGEDSTSDISRGMPSPIYSADSALS